MFCGALNRILRKKSKQVCKRLVSEELDGSRLILKKRAFVQPTWTKDLSGEDTANSR